MKQYKVMKFYEDTSKSEDYDEYFANFVKICRKNLFESVFHEGKNTLMEFISSSKSFKIPWVLVNLFVLKQYFLAKLTTTTLFKFKMSLKIFVVGFKLVGFILILTN